MEHHVYFWLKEKHRNPEDLIAFEEGLDGLFKIQGVTGGFWGKPAPVMERPVIDQSWDYALSIQFASVDTQNAYQIDPLHDQFIEKFSTWWAQVQVRDLLPGR